MGAWGYGILGNTVALEIRDRFEKYIKEGYTVTEATDLSITEYSDAMNDVCVVLAIAALQTEQGQLSPQFRDRAIQLFKQTLE